MRAIFCFLAAFGLGVGGAFAQKHKKNGEIPAFPLDGGRLSQHWEVKDGRWGLYRQTLFGEGRAATADSAARWGFIWSRKPLPKDFILTCHLRLVSGEMAEVALFADAARYVRVYLYEIDQNLVLGAGKTYDEGQGNWGGGPSVVEQPVVVEKSRWYRLKISVAGTHYRVFLDDVQVLEHDDSNGALPRNGRLGFFTNGKLEIKELFIKNNPRS